VKHITAASTAKTHYCSSVQGIRWVAETAKTCRINNCSKHCVNATVDLLLDASC